VIDAGSGFDVVSEIESAVGSIDALVLTHTHSDHVGNLDAIVDAFGVGVWGFDTSREDVDHAIADDETIRLGDDDYRAIHTPGHKDDPLCFYSPESAVLFAGDLVFANGGFGRTDLAEGDRATLIRSIESVLEATAPGLDEFHSGHGPSVTTNPRQDVELALQAARMNP
jgi:hydroxyacylglutathione hydrolase